MEARRGNPVHILGRMVDGVVLQNPPPWNIRCSQYIMKSAATRNRIACSHNGSVDSGPWPLS